MGLDEYRRKRRLEATPEPPGGGAPEPGPRVFVVQKHRARRLHYDFRLEVDGVLKSWALPKGPTSEPGEKHLAVRVEDHPIEYRDFEGVIPEGNYGAGEVIVWDRGVYTTLGDGSPEDDAARTRAGLEKGHLTLVLLGEKLKGEFALIRFRREEGKELWLFTKARKEVPEAEPTVEAERSVLSGRTLEEVREAAPGEGRYWVGTTPADLEHRELPRAPFPHEVRPMLPTLVKQPFDHAGWLFEVQWEGVRARTEIEGGEVRISSEGVSLNDRFPSIVRALQSAPQDMLLDGEIVVLDERGRPHRESLENLDPAQADHLIYYVFDLLYLDGYDLRGRPLRERKELLQQVLPKVPTLRYSDHIWEHGRDFFEAAKEQGVGGIVGKDGESPYVSGRTRRWVRMKSPEA